MKALTFSRFGDASVLDYSEVPMPALQAGEVLVQMRAIGLNYADIYRRKGDYHLKGQPPYIAGYEGSGVVVESNGVEGLSNGDRIAFADVPFAQAQFVAVPLANAIALPDDIGFELAAALLLQGMTAHYLCNDSHSVQSGEFVVVHAASGGVGQVLTQLCRAKGARVIGLTSSRAKEDAIRKIGAEAVFNLRDDWQRQVRSFTGQGADVVYDSIGSTLMDSIDVARECGHIVFYGMSGGNPPLVNPRTLMDSSKTLTGGDLWSYLNTRDQRTQRANALFALIRQGQLILAEPKRFGLEQGRQAHEHLESGKSMGKVLLMP
ncbi:alcohol dehydrogenase [Limnohabitans sp. 2KL-17]|uniref:quinone oxidoreductase family protein n=1 Tax=Limnohabitans sp. 2KL-17 TaxID=1100704 RepID=UPI000D354682|nr:quinone oxidoreductase [Limnohabitans sp. 2KL-17]PUE63254.1 alcohol dehydrogenase [Limnohabitans sp. 2KL-17]